MATGVSDCQMHKDTSHPALSLSPPCICAYVCVLNIGELKKERNKQRERESERDSANTDSVVIKVRKQLNNCHCFS